MASAMKRPRPCRLPTVLAFICGFVVGKLDTPDCLPLEGIEIKPPCPEVTKPPDLFTDRVASFMVGAARVWKDELLQKFDPGLPQGTDFTNKTVRGEEEAWLFYSHKNVQPPNFTQETNHLDHHHLSVEEATVNCKSVEIMIRHDPQPHHTCFAIVGNQDSLLTPIHYRWLQLNSQKEGELVPAGRGDGVAFDGLNWFGQPEERELKTHRMHLANYLTILDKILIPHVQPILEQVAIAVSGSESKYVIVTAVSAGHVPLLHNFVCSCKARNFDISNFVVFCLDTETRDRANAMGLTTVYHEQLFGAIPSGEGGAVQFADETFKAVVYCKLVVGHLLSIMGYNFLYQDVDIVWYQHPLTFLQKGGYLNKFDLLFQDDGDRTAPFFAPHMANSGFFVSKSNAKTAYFFRELLYNGDNLPVRTSEQPIFGAMLPEAINYLGMRVKTLSQRDFPAGHMFMYWANFGDFMEKLVTDQVKPVLFHMHFTINAAQKIRQMKQMGLWFLKMDDDGKEYVCAKEPVVECFHWDCPSVPSCRDHNMTQAKAKSPYHRFWT